MSEPQASHSGLKVIRPSRPAAAAAAKPGAPAAPLQSATAAAIASRFEQDASASKPSATKRPRSQMGVILLGFVILGVLAYYFCFLHGKVSFDNLTVDTIVKPVKDLIPASVSPPPPERPSAKASISMTALTPRTRYDAVAALFAQGALAHWRDAPAELKVKNAPAGSVYHALVPRDDTFDLYEMKAGGGVARLSPIGPDVAFAVAEFRQACGGRPYFIARSGHVFVCGKGDLKAMDDLRKALLTH